MERIRIYLTLPSYFIPAYFRLAQTFMILKLRKILFIILISSSVYAQTDFDSSFYFVAPINVSSSRILMRQEDSPFLVQHIGNDYIQKTNGNQLSDVLKTVNNVYVKSYGGNSSLKTISLNGLSAEHTLILLNGVRLNSFQNSQFDLSLLPKESIESIEIMPSGSSALYGSDAVSGVVNIKTASLPEFRNGTPITAGVSAEIGSYDYKKYNVNLSGRHKNSGLKLSYFNESSKDNFDYYYFNGYENELKDRRNNSYSKDNVYIDYLLQKGGMKVSMVSYYNFTDRSIPGIETGSEPANAFQKDKNWNTIINLESSGKNLFAANLSFQNNLTQYSPYPGELNFYKNLTYSASASYTIRNEGFKLLAGGDFSAATIESDNISGFRQRNVAALYLSNETKISELISVFPSLRFENISDLNRQALTGKAGINFKPLNNNLLILKSSFGNSFRSPTFNDLYWKIGGNPGLQPEKSYNFEAGVLSVFNFIGHNSIEASYSYTKAFEKIVWVPGSYIYWSPLNLGNSVSNIFSISFNSEYEIQANSTLKLNLNYSRNSSLKKNEDFTGDPTYNKQLIYIPKDLFKLNLDYSIESFGVTASGILIGERYTDFENRIAMNPDFILDGSIYLNTSIAGLNAGLRFEVNNITNENYQVISGYPMPLRNYKFIINIKY